MSVVVPCLFFIVGLAAGALHFVALRRTTDLIVASGSALTIIGQQVSRMAITIAVLAVAAHAGWVSLLACAAGFLVARQVVVRKLGWTHP